LTAFPPPVTSFSRPELVPHLFPVLFFLVLILFLLTYISQDEKIERSKAREAVQEVAAVSSDLEDKPPPVPSSLA
jgi:hypothetical protein